MYYRVVIMQNSLIYVGFNDVIVKLDLMGSIVEMYFRIKFEIFFVWSFGSWRKFEFQFF